MKIKLKKVVLENFMCYAQAVFEFFDITKIMAKNGVGKSTIATAYLWCLFNCDYELRDNPQVRREVDGKTIDDMDTSVELTLDVDGKEVTMKKVQKRTYRKDGSSYKDDNKYFINDVPKTLKDFNAYLDIDMNVFKMCSNVNAFLNQKPAEMREYLFGLAGNVSDIDIASKKAELAELVPLLKKYSAEELSAMNKATKSKITKDLPVLDGQIKEKERDIQLKQDVDISDLELQRNDFKERIAENLEKQTDQDKLLEGYDRANSELFELQTKASDLQKKANEDLYAKRSGISDEIMQERSQLSSVKYDLDALEIKISDCQATIAREIEEKNRLSVVWVNTEREVFDESTTVCPTCHRELPQDEIESMRNDFKKSKKERLDKIEDAGMDAKSKIENEKDVLAELEQNKEKLLHDKAAIDEKLTELKKQLVEMPTEIDVSGTDEYKKIQKMISEKEKELLQASDISSAKAELKAQETDLRQYLAECESKIASANTEQDEQRLEELRKSKIDSEQNKTNAEKILDLLDELDKAKNEALTDAVNSHFALVKWQLFEFAKNGNYKSVCIPTVDGKSILTTMSNKGNRILGRVDICNSIQQISGISAPIILDDAESLSQDNQNKVAEMVDSQLIMLIVNDSEKLEIVGQILNKESEETK